MIDKPLNSFKGLVLIMIRCWKCNYQSVSRIGVIDFNENIHFYITHSVIFVSMKITGLRFALLECSEIIFTIN